MHLSDLRVLWVDDSFFAARIYVQFLATLGCTNVVVLAGVDAGTRAMHLTRLENFDIVFTDRKMPRHDGFCVAKAVRRSDLLLGRSPTPILMCTVDDGIAGKRGVWTEGTRCFARRLQISLVVRSI